MGHMFITASKSVRGGSLHLTSFILTPLNDTTISAHMTLYNATAATDGKQIIFVRCNTANISSVSWNGNDGVRLDNLYVTISGGVTTIAWN